MDFLNSTLAALLLLAPGFLTLRIHDHFQGRTTRGGQFEKTMLSLILSAFLALPFFALNGLRSAEDLGPHLAAHPVLTPADALLLTLGAAFLLGVVTSERLRLFFHKMLRPTSKVSYDEQYLWDRTLEKHFLKPATVTLNDGSKYYGFIDGHSTADEPSMLRLAKARDVTRGDRKRKRPASSDFLVRGDLVKSIEIDDDAKPAKLHEEKKGERAWRWLAATILLVAFVVRVAYALHTS